MTTTPTLPPQPWFMIEKDAAGNLTAKTSEPFRQHYAALWKNAGATNNAVTSNINSGVAQAQAAALAAQSAADAAATGTNDLAAATLPFSASIAPTSRNKGRSGTGSITSLGFTVSWAGGTGPFTVLWTVASGDTVDINSPTATTTTVTGALPSLGSDLSTVLRATVTDSLAAEASAAASNYFSETS